MKVVNRLHVLFEFAGKRKDLRAHLACKLDSLLGVERLALIGRRRMVLDVFLVRGSERKLLVADLACEGFDFSVKVVNRLHVLFELEG
jgi:hypothetical protein